MIIFFIAATAKGIWLYLPMGILLLLNTIMFIATVYTICKFDEKRRQTLNSEIRGEKFERYEFI